MTPPKSKSSAVSTIMANDPLLHHEDRSDLNSKAKGRSGKEDDLVKLFQSFTPAVNDEENLRDQSASLEILVS